MRGIQCDICKKFQEGNGHAVKFYDNVVDQGLTANSYTRTQNHVAQVTDICDACFDELMKQAKAERSDPVPDIEVHVKANGPIGKDVRNAT